MADIIFTCSIDVAVDEAVEKLIVITPESDGERDQSAHTMFNMVPMQSQARPISIPGRMPTSDPSRRSRLPTGPTEDSLDQGITMLSPKTPSMVGAPNFPEMFHNHGGGGHSQDMHNMEFAMEALDSYANAPQQMIPYSSQASYDPNLTAYKTMFDIGGTGQQQQTQSTMANNFSIPPPNLNSPPQPQPSYANSNFANPQDPRGLSPNVAISSASFGFPSSPMPPPAYTIPPPNFSSTSNTANTY